MSSFCCSCPSIFWIWLLSVMFLSRSFSAIAPFARNFSSIYRTAFSATVLPVRKFSAPVTMSRLNSYASFLISEIRTSVSSIDARSESRSFSELLPTTEGVSSQRTWKAGGRSWSGAVIGRVRRTPLSPQSRLEPPPSPVMQPHTFARAPRQFEHFLQLSCSCVCPFPAVRPPP